MAIRVQPADIEIPADDPFANDLLGRKDAIEALATLVGSIDGPCVMAVDASWGMGKTTFLRMWAQHLRNAGHPVAEFNAWETDFTRDSFFALWAEISSHFARQPGPDPNGNLANLARRLLPFLDAGARSASLAFAVGGEPEAAATAGGVSATLREFVDAASAAGHEPNEADLMPFPEATYVEAKALLHDFRTSLQEEAASLAGTNDGLPLVVLIDELDRCRPPYAIELLETAKHLFSVDRIVFVLGLDREQLAHSIRAVYGSEFDAEGYLRRFFDIDYHLLNPSRERLIQATLDSIGITESIAARPRPTDNDWHSNPETFAEIFSLPNLSLRDSLQLVHRFGVVLSSVSSEKVLFSDALAVLMVLRTVNASLYRRVLDGDATDEEAVTAMYANLGEELSFHSTAKLAIEGVLAACVCVASRDSQNEPNLDKIPMLRRYHEIATNPTPQEQTYDPEPGYAGIVLAYVNRFFDRPYAQGRYELGTVRDSGIFRLCVQRLELFPDGSDDVGIREPPR